MQSDRATGRQRQKDVPLRVHAQWCERLAEHAADPIRVWWAVKRIRPNRLLFFCECDVLRRCLGARRILQGPLLCACELLCGLRLRAGLRWRGGLSEQCSRLLLLLRQLLPLAPRQLRGLLALLLRLRRRRRRQGVLGLLPHRLLLRSRQLPRLLNRHPSPAPKHCAGDWCRRRVWPSRTGRATEIAS